MSIDEIWWLSQTIDTWSGGKEWAEKVTDAMKEAIAEQARQGKLIAGQIAGSKAQHKMCIRDSYNIIWWYNQ